MHVEVQFNTHVAGMPFCQDAFINTLEKVVLKKRKYTITIDEGWYTEAELRNDLGWSQCLPYLQFRDPRSYACTLAVFSQIVRY